MRDRGNAEPGLPEVVGVVRAGAVVAHRHRSLAVEEAAPFVVGDHEEAAPPLRRHQERLEHDGHERGGDPDVALGVRVRTQGSGEARVDHHHVRQRARRRLLEVAVDGRDVARHLLAPEQQERDVGVVVGGGNAVAPQQVPDRPRMEDAVLERAGIGLAPLRLRGVHVHPVRKRRAEQRRVVTVGDGEVLGDGPVVRQRLTVEVRDRERVVAGAATEETAVALARPWSQLCPGSSKLQPRNAFASVPSTSSAFPVLITSSSTVR